MSLTLTVLIAALLWVSPYASSAQDEILPLFYEAPTLQSPAIPNYRAIIRARPVSIDFSSIVKPACYSRGEAAFRGRLQLNLFGDLSLTSILDRVEQVSPDGFTWIGRIEGEELSKVILVVRDGVMAGHIRTPKEVYEVRCAGNGVHVICQIDPCAVPGSSEPFCVDLPAPTSRAKLARADDGSAIDVLVVYTQTAREMNGGVDGIETLIALAVEQTNDAYANSHVTQRLNLVHMEEVTYAESGTYYVDLNNLQGGWEGLDVAHVLRETYNADLVSMIVYNLGGVAGAAYTMQTVSHDFESYAFSVVCSGYATSQYSFAHELGHNMGCEHDRINATIGQGAYPFSYGYQDTEGAFRTIMAYKNGCPGTGECDQIPYFSNPDVSYGGEPTGIDYQAANSADNARTLNSTASTVANFRNGDGPAPGPTPIPVPGELLNVSVSSNSPSTGDPFTVNVVVQPVSQRFDAWGVIMGPGAVYSFILNNPGALRTGAEPLATNVRQLSKPYTGTLFSISGIPQGVAGDYTVIVGLVPAGTSPAIPNAIPGYVDQEVVIVQK